MFYVPLYSSLHHKDPNMCVCCVERHESVSTLSTSLSACQQSHTATPHLTLLPDTRILAMLEPGTALCLDAIGIEVCKCAMNHTYICRLD